jgi:hypothetical protein
MNGELHLRVMDHSKACSVLVLHAHLLLRAVCLLRACDSSGI